MSRTKYGDQRGCETCGMDIEWHGKPRRRVLIEAGTLINGQHYTERDVTMVAGGWIDRGSNRFCDESGAAKWDQDGHPIKLPHRLHRPTR